MLLTVSASLTCAQPPAAALQGSLGGMQAGPALPGSDRGTTSGAQDAAPNSMLGGGAMADFATLINLIQTTIDPDGWLANGGTSSMLEYPAGVYVDPRGQLRRVREELPPSSPILQARGSSMERVPWRNDSRLRTISLKQLDTTLAKYALAGQTPPIEVLRLAGLSRIQYVHIDAGQEDILLSGPAESGQAGYQLRDLVLVANLITHQTDPLGCSIEPDNSGILAAQQFLSSSAALKALARKPQLVVEQMRERIGPHNIRVFGLPANSSTAVALIDADEHMKRVGFGSESTRVPIDSYFDHLDKQDSVPGQSLIRWWFAYADSPVSCNAARDTFELPEQCVTVLSEQQWVSQSGRAASGASDPSADAFAAGISGQLSDLRRTRESYARLCAVFESALALQLGLEATGQPNWQAWFPSLCRLGQWSNAEVPPARTVEGLTAWHRLQNGTTVAVVSGGVLVAPHATASAANWRESRFLASSIVPPPPPAVKSGQWWWD